MWCSIEAQWHVGFRETSGMQQNGKRRINSLVSGMYQMTSWFACVRTRGWSSPMASIGTNWTFILICYLINCFFNEKKPYWFELNILGLWSKRIASCVKTYWNKWFNTVDFSQKCKKHQHFNEIQSFKGFRASTSTCFWRLIWISCLFEGFGEQIPILQSCIRAGTCHILISGKRKWRFLSCEMASVLCLLNCEEWKSIFYQVRL